MRDDGDMTSPGKLNWNPTRTEPNRTVLSREGESLDCDVRDGPRRLRRLRGVSRIAPGPLHGACPACGTLRVRCATREVTRRGVGIASPLFNSIATCISLITGNILPATALDDCQRSSFSLLFRSHLCNGPIGKQEAGTRSVPIRAICRTRSRTDVRTF